MAKNITDVIILIALCFCGTKGSLSLSAETVDRVSVLTCTEGDELYSLFGHTAIRCVFTDSTDYKYDVAFNYGAFNYSSDNFVYNFVRGKTDYILAPEPTNEFMARYRMKGIGVTEQVLNLSDPARQKLLAYLINNAKPENCTYRYNWFRDNCTTRARDALESIISGEINYSLPKEMKTCRECLHEYTYVGSWLQFGIDLVLGSEIDRTMDEREQMFLPREFQQSLDGAYIKSAEGNKVCLVKETLQPVPQVLKIEKAPVNWPLILFAVLFLLYTVVGAIEIRNMEVFRRFAVVLYGIVGLVGCLVAFLFLFSEHAGVDTNCLVAIFNPLYFALIPFVMQRRTKEVGLAVLATIVIFVVWAIVSGQSVNLATWLLVLTLLTRVCVNLVIYFREKYRGDDE